MLLNLTAEEREVVLAALISQHTELHDEIVHTDNFDLREALKSTRLLLVGVLERLEPGWAAGAGLQPAEQEQQAEESYFG